MPKIMYINGEYSSHENSKVHVNDRGYHFGDAVYEVVIFNNKIFYDFDGHIQRLFKSLTSLEIKFSLSSSSLKIIINNLIRLNKANIGSVYIQVSRGVAERNHSFHGLNIKPILTIIVTKKSNIENNLNGVKAITLNDNRWSRPDIKTTQRYAHLHDDPVNQAVDKIDQQLESQDCDSSAISAHYMLGQDVGLQGTPAIVLEDGSMVNGYVSAAQLAKIISPGN